MCQVAMLYSLANQVLPDGLSNTTSTGFDFISKHGFWKRISGQGFLLKKTLYFHFHNPSVFYYDYNLAVQQILVTATLSNFIRNKVCGSVRDRGEGCDEGSRIRKVGRQGEVEGQG